MKKQTKLLAPVFMLLVCVFFVLYAQNQSQQKKAVAAHRAGPKPTPLAADAKKFPGLPNDLRAPPAQSNQECAAFNDTLTHQPLETSLYDLQNGKLKIPTTCEVGNDAGTKLYYDLVAKCIGSEARTKPDDCNMSLFMYRSVQIDFVTNGQNVKDLSTDVLVQKFFGLLFGNNLGDKNDEAKSVIEELRDRLPASAGVDRMDVMRMLAQKDFPKDPAFDAALAKARASDPDDQSLYEIQLIGEREKNYSDYAAVVTKQFANDPTNPILVYHMGCVQWHDNQRDAAVASFQQALALTPGDQRFAETLEKARTAVLGKPVCQVTMGVNPNQI